MRFTILLILEFFIFSLSFIFAQTGIFDAEISTKEKNSVVPCEKKPTEFVYISPKKIKEFTEELNRYGGCGYGLEKSGKIPLKMERSEADAYFFGIIKLDSPNKFEYEWFESHAPGQALNYLILKAGKGFAFRASYPFQRLNDDDRDLDGSNSGTFIILERKNGEEKEREYLVLNGNHSTRQRLREQNQKAFNDALAQGFRPVGLNNSLTNISIVMEKDEEISPKGEYLIINESLGMLKKLNELSIQGYEPVLLGDYFALVRKTDQTPASFKVTHYPEDLPKDLSDWKTAVYRISGAFPTSASAGDFHTSLYFALSENDKTTRYEYKLQKMTNVAGRAKGKEKDTVLREPPPAEILAEFHNRLKEGYAIREILASKEIYVLFERPLP